MLLSDNETDFVWNKVYELFHFNPSINKGEKAFDIPCTYVVYDISNLNVESIEVMDELITKAFVNCTNKNDFMYALDWQHSSFKFNPRNQEEQKSMFIQDERYMGGGYNAYFPTYYPDGDYYFFIAGDFSFGYLGHPWQQKVWVFGKSLISEFEKIENKIGFVKV
jgi:hypothetical protein